eukprot:5301918-Amphidinium_carterae.2
MRHASYVKYHYTSGYHRATPEIKWYDEGFQIYNFNDKCNPQQPVDEDDNRATTLQQLLAITYHYAPHFFDAMKEQELSKPYFSHNFNIFSRLFGNLGVWGSVPAAGAWHVA